MAWRRPLLRRLAPRAPLAASPRVQIAAHSSVAAQNKLIVVLDLDECLIHSTGFGNELEGSHRQYEASRSKSTHHEDIESFKLRVGNDFSCTVLKRPGVDAFLKAVSAQFEVYTFTAGTQSYAEPLLDTLDPGRKMLKGRRYRHHCREVSVPGAGSQYLKDLTAVTDELHRCVLVDNNPLSFICQPRNGIPVPDFTGQPDEKLDEVLRLLQALAAFPDVRPPLDKLYNLQEKLASARQYFLGGESKL